MFELMSHAHIRKATRMWSSEYIYIGYNMHWSYFSLSWLFIIMTEVLLVWGAGHQAPPSLLYTGNSILFVLSPLSFSKLSRPCTLFIHNDRHGFTRVTGFQLYLIVWNEHSSTLLVFISFLLKGQCHEIFDFRFFTWISFPTPLIIPLRPFQIFSTIRGDIRQSRCITGINVPNGV